MSNNEMIKKLGTEFLGGMAGAAGSMMLTLFAVKLTKIAESKIAKKNAEVVTPNEE